MGPMKGILEYVDDEVVSDHVYVHKDLMTITYQGSTLYKVVDLAILYDICFRCREVELSSRRIYRTAIE